MCPGSQERVQVPEYGSHRKEVGSISVGHTVCAKLVQNMINDSCHHLFSELQHAEFKEAFNEFDKVRIYIFYYRVSHSEKCKVNQI